MSDSRYARLKARIKELPERPGVYLHKNAADEVIYVGKARNLRSRVSSYLIGKGARDAKTMTLVGEIDSIDFVTTNNELEAILLENNLIKAHQPRYNILLRDVNLPSIKGNRLSEVLKSQSNKKDIPIVLISDLPEKSLEEMFPSSGANAWMRKPLTRDKMVDMINKHVPAS